MTNSKCRKTEAVPNHNFEENIDEKNFEEQKDESFAVKEKEEAEELQGKLKKDNRDDALLHSKINVDKDKIDKARVLTDAINNNISTFSPDLAFEQMVNNYNSAKQIMGPTLIRELSGYDPNYIEKNIKIPEFQRELKDRIKNNVEKLKQEGLLDKDGSLSDEGYDFAALSMISEELDKLEGEGYVGKKESKKKSDYGEKEDYREYRQGDRYKDLALKQTVKKSLRRGHKEIIRKDLVINERKATGKIDVIYAIDASGSMKGEKIKVAKKAGIALAYNAIKNNDKAGLVIFGSEINIDKEPSKDFFELAKTLTKIKTKGETDIALSIDHSIKLFNSTKSVKHIVLLTDALQTAGKIKFSETRHLLKSSSKEPEKEVLEKVSIAANEKISISVIGIGMNTQGEKLAKNIVDISKGKLYKVQDLENVDQIVLEDYYNTRSNI